MTTHRPIFGPGRLRVSKIVYNCDVSREGALVIPLGAIADIRAGHWYGLALQARSEVLQEELSCVGKLARPLVGHPFSSLKLEFERIFKADHPGDEFKALPNVHSTSLMILPMIETRFEIPTSIAKESAHDVQKAFLTDQVRALVIDKYWELMVSCGHAGPPEILAEAEYSQAA